MKVLLTGFDPFGGESVNPAFEAIKLLPDTIAGAEIVKVEIPTEFTRSISCVEAAIKEHNPDVVIDVGQAGGRAAMTVERVAINCEDCPSGFPDNEGNAPQDEKIYADGPDAYFATIPIKAMVKKMMDNGVPASVSNTAGTYVCNDLMYHLLYQLAHEFPNTRGGFIHVPYATIQNHPNMASMTLEEISRGLLLSVEAAIENEQDIAAAGGATH